MLVCLCDYSFEVNIRTNFSPFTRSILIFNDFLFDFTTDSPYREDNQCGGGWLAPNGEVAQCDPEGIYPCCSPHNWCGNTPDHCDCADCIDYREVGKK